MVAEIARRAARHFKPAPLLQDVPLDLRTPLLHVSVVPKGDSDKLLDYNMQASIEYIVIGPKDNVLVETAVQPIRPLVTDTTVFQNLFGATFAVPDNTAMVSFPVEGAMSAIENDDLRIYIISPGGSGSWDCDIAADDIRKMFRALSPREMRPNRGR